MSELPDIPDSVPPGMSRLSISAEIMDYLEQYWEIRDHGELFAWSVRLLHDLTKLDEAGWRLTLSKANVDETTKLAHESPDYRHMVFMLRWLAPTKEGFMRLPSVEALEKATRIVKT